MKKYSVISIVLIGVCGFWIYVNTNTSTTLNFFGNEVTLLNALWAMFFLFLFFIFSIVYFGIVRFKNFSFEKNIKRDRENIVLNIKNALLDKPKNAVVKNMQDINEFVSMVFGFEIKPKKSDTFPFLDDLIRVQNGEVLDLGKYKFDKNNKWYIQNLKNSLNNGDLSKAKEALLVDALKDKALEVLGKNSNAEDVLKNNYPIYKETILNNLDSHKVAELIEKSDLSNEEYIQIAKIMHKNEENPERLLGYFEKKIYPYLYLLIEYEMIDKAMELAKENHIKFFEYYLALRERGLKITIDEYMDAKDF